MRSFLGKIKRLFVRPKNSAEYWRLRESAKTKRGISGYFATKKYFKLMEKSGANIPLSTEFDGAPVFPHGLNGIFISAGAKVGKGCTIFHQVTIGSNTLADSKGAGAPVICDNVYIGAGAKIIGGIRVGNNARIGANCVVVKDVPDNATVVLESPRVIVHDSPRDNRFLLFK